ncbi:MAG: DUF2282 domain-containing protein [Rhodospirillales bacterium]|nr:DUF2282 domain-containing protein [Rhodospirillales bacterium]
MTKASALAVAAAVTGALGYAALTGSASAQTEKMVKFEKCYGVTKAGKNDCQTASSSCAGTSKKDAQSDAWLYVPVGTCDKLVGGSMTPKAS